MYKNIGILGLGLIGGSIAKALKSRCRIKNITAYNRHQDVLNNALNEGIITKATTKIDSSFSDCDLIFICTPVDTIFSYAKELSKIVKKDCVITDVGSTKSGIYKSMELLNDKFYYIGGHPMTGSEKSRYTASKEHLFENAYYIITPNKNTPKQKIEEFKNIILNFGSIPVELEPQIHDFVVAAISHVPHIIASGLVKTVKSLDNNACNMHTLAAGGFKDITRVASSNPTVFQTICLENKSEIIKVLNEFETIIHNMKILVEQSDSSKIYDYFDSAKKYRDSFTCANPGTYVNRYEINVDVLDKPGSIAIISVLLSSNNINIKNMSIVNNRENDNGVLSIAFDSENQRQKSITLLKEMNYEVFSKN